MTPPTLVLVHESAASCVHALGVLRRRRGPIHLLVLPGGGPRGPVARRLTEAFPDRVTEIDPRPHLEPAADSIRRALVRFAAEWPDRLIDGRSFKSRFVHEGLSLWWLTALSEKNNEDRPTFDLLCDVELVRRVLAGETVRHVRRAVIVTGSTDFHRVCRRFLRSRGIDVGAMRPRRLVEREGVAQLLLLRLRRCGSWCVRVAAARWWRRPAGEPATSPPDVAFYTWYPSQWVTRGGALVDRYYVDLPDFLRSTSRLRVAYAATSHDLPLVRHFRVLRALARREAPLDHRELLEGYLRIRDVLKAYWGSLAPLRYCLFERTSREFRESFIWDGVDMFELLRRDLRISFLARIPDHLLVGKQVERFVAARKPKVLVTYLEVYCHGRAVIHGAKRGWPDVTTIGYQHSAITRNKLFYRFEPNELARAGSYEGGFVHHAPLPDRFAATGPFGGRILAEGGYPAEKLWIIGSPRFDALRDAATGEADRAGRRRELGIEPHRTVVLVTGSIFKDATRYLLEQAMLAVKGRAEYFVLFKLHPFNQRDASAQIQRLADGHGYTSYAVTDRDVQCLLAMSDALVSSNSTTAAEALALGVPVINLRIGHLDLSPIADVPDAAFEAWDQRGIAAALAEITGRSARLGQVMANAQGLVSGTFLRLDGGARERFAAKLLETIGECA